jgi:outer membrane immunogenic protein
MNKQSAVSALALFWVAWACSISPVAAATPEQISARLDALEKEIAALRRENATLRQRVERRETAPPARAAAETANAPIYAAAPIVTKGPTIVPPAPYSWTGLYVGGHGGAGWARKAWAGEAFDDPCQFEFEPLCSTDLGSHNAIGPLGGGQIGFNWQGGPLVFGIEGQYSLAALKGNHTNTKAGTLTAGDATASITLNSQLSSEITDLASIAARVGVAGGASGGTLFYVKGGAAYVKEEFAAQQALGILTCNPDCGGGTFTFEGKGQDSRWGWMAGAGIEHQLIGNWSAKVEYNYLHFGDESVRLRGTGCVIGETTECGPGRSKFDIDQSVHLIKFGLNYRFGGNY